MRTRPTDQPASRGRAADLGFTLLELMLVLAMLGIIVAVAVPSVSGMGKRSILMAQAEDIATRIAGAREMAMARAKCVAVHVDSASPRKLEMAILKNNVVNCELAVADGTGAVGIKYDGAETNLDEIKIFETDLARRFEMDTTTLNTDAAKRILIWRPNGWIRANNFGAETSLVVSDDSWYLRLRDTSLPPGVRDVNIIVLPQGPICVKQGSTVCP